MMTLTAQKLKEFVKYDPLTGIFTRIIRTSNRINVGDIAGSKDHYGYLRFNIESKVYKASRLAWLYMTGEWPKEEIDHKNGIRDDNRFNNLREVGRIKNMENQRNARDDNKIGLLGVSRQADKYRSQIQVNGKKKHLGMFDTPELAHQVYLSAKRKLHKGCTI